MRTVAIIGPGRVGGALGRALRIAGYTITAVAGRTTNNTEALAASLRARPAAATAAAASAEIVLLTVPDAAIAMVAATLPARLGQIFLHTSGAAGAEILAPCRRQGAAVGSLHPLQTIADPLAADQLRGTYFGIEGDADAVTAGQELARACGGIPLIISSGAKALYHAGAVMLSNYVVTLAALAKQLWQAAGLEPDVVVPALSPLLNGALVNLQRYGIPAALTGPIERGDLTTVRRHLAALADQRARTDESTSTADAARPVIGAFAPGPHLLAVYRALALATVEVAIEKGLAPAAADSLKQILTDPKSAKFPPEGSRY